jgi:hypothetical protein
MTSSSAAAVDGGWETSLFQLEGDISEEYGKKYVSFHRFRLERLLQMQKSGVHGKKQHRKAGGNLNDAVPTYPIRSSIKEINDDCSI